MAKEAYLTTTFNTQKEEDNLKRIEILGILAERTESGYAISEKSENFLYDCVARTLFLENRTLSKYSFESLKIWLYDSSKPRDSQGHLLPEGDDVAFVLHSHLEASELKRITVLDVGLSGNQYKLWKTGCEELLQPMFSRFIAPPEPPDVLKEFLEMRFGAKLTNRIDLYLSMRKNMRFDELIIEAK